MSLNTLRRIEAGLKAELEVLRTNEIEFFKQDVEASDSIEQFVLQRDVDLAALHEVRDFLFVQREEVEQKLAKTLQHTRSFASLTKLQQQHGNDGDDGGDGDEASLEDRLAAEVKLLRRRTLQFAKAQYPVPQVQDEFEGGDFWDACIAHCADQEESVEYSVEREGAFAELLLQSGLFERVENKTTQTTKRIKLINEAYASSSSMMH